MYLQFCTNYILYTFVTNAFSHVHHQNDAKQHTRISAIFFKTFSGTKLDKPLGVPAATSRAICMFPSPASSVYLPGSRLGNGYILMIPPDNS